MRISEDFYSVQCEGDSQGVPAYFIRLQGCNLLCTWCDTVEVWKRGKITPNEVLESRMIEAGQIKNILKGETHLVWTGGEPTLKHNLESIKIFLDYLNKKYGPNKIYSEIETNGTTKVDKLFYGKYLSQINCSPKLRNSKMSAKRRINEEAIKQIKAHKNSWFKFVISSEKDILEMEKDYIKPFKILKKKVILMPESDNIITLPEATRICYDLTKKFGYRTITRGHILAWNRKTGV